jgi:geranylgeranyl reductase family protein
MRDVFVIGGGPGGLYAAQQLSKNGFDVAVIEEHSEIGRPVHCTGIMGKDSFSEYDLPRSAILNDLRTVRFYSPSGQTFSYTHDRIEAVVVDRSVFDEALGRDAKAAGATMIHETRATSIQNDSSHVRIKLRSGEELKARACVLACGANYTVQRTLGLGTPSFFLSSAQAELPAGPEGDVEMHFSSQTAPKGFAWVVPVRRGTRNYVRVGLMCEAQVEERFRSFVLSVAPRWDIPGGLDLKPVRKILPLAPISRTFADRLLIVGDAAGLVKPTTGGGIYYSIVSGAIAANVLADSLKSDRLDAGSLSIYATRWQQRLGSELKAQMVFRHHAQSLADSDIEDIFDLVRTDGVLPLVRKSAKFNQHRKLIWDLLRHTQFRQILLRPVTR